MQYLIVSMVSISTAYAVFVCVHACGFQPNMLILLVASLLVGLFAGLMSYYVVSLEYSVYALVGLVILIIIGTLASVWRFEKGRFNQTY